MQFSTSSDPNALNIDYVAPLGQGKRPPEGAATHAGLLCQTAAFVQCIFAGFQFLLASQSGMRWPAFVLLVAGLVRALMLFSAGKTLTYRPFSAAQPLIWLYSVLAFCETLLGYFLLRKTFSDVAFAADYNGAEVYAQLQSQETIALWAGSLLFPLVFLAILYSPLLKQFRATRERKRLPDLGYEGVGTLMTIGSGVSTVIGAGLMWLFFKHNTDWSSPPGLILAAIFALITARGPMQFLCARKVLSGLNSDDGRQSIESYARFGLVTAVIMGAAIFTSAVVLGASVAGSLPTALAITLFFSAWPMTLRKYVGETFHEAIMENPDAAFFGRASDGGQTAVGWLLAFAVAIGLGQVAPQLGITPGQDVDLTSTGLALSWLALAGFAAYCHLASHPLRTISSFALGSVGLIAAAVLARPLVKVGLDARLDKLFELQATHALPFLGVVAVGISLAVLWLGISSHRNASLAKATLRPRSPQKA